MSDMKNEIMHGPLGSPFEACKNDVTPQSGEGQKGGVDFPPFGQWKQASSELPILTGVSVGESLGGSNPFSTPMDATNNGSGIGSSGSSGTGSKGQGGISTPYVEPWSMKG